MRRIYMKTEDGLIEFTKEDQESAAQYAPWLYLIKILGMILIGIISLIMS